MYFCVGVFLTALKICKAPLIKQKQLGEKIFQTLYPGYDCGDDDSAISAVFRGKRNLNSYLQLLMDDLDEKTISLNFRKNVIPLLDENKHAFLVRVLQKWISQSDIGDETHIELVNGIKKKDLIKMNEVVLEDFLVGIFLYSIKNTENLSREKDVRAFKVFAEEFENSEYDKPKFIEQYFANPMFFNKTIRPIKTLYKNAGCIIDVVAIDLFEIPEKKELKEKVNIVIPVNTTFETKIEEKSGDENVPLVSENTIHEQWIVYMRNKKCLCSAELNKKIERSLKNRGLSKCRVCCSTVGNTDVYPIASVATVDVDNVKFFLLAVSEFDKENKAHSKITDIIDSLESMIDLYDKEGQGFDLYVPLIGSGRSRTGISLQKAYNLLVAAVIRRKNEIYGRIHIVIYPSQIEEIRLEKKRLY